MNTFYGVWSPKDGILPNVSDLDFAAYYITDSGTLDNQEYNKDNWLIYICESRGTLSERSYWRVSNGLVVVNPDSHTNVPDSGYYTKVRLDNAGNIVAASDIEYDDLPETAKKKFEAITDDNLNKLISKQLSSIFKNNVLSPIQFHYDNKTGKISATLDIDEETININEMGQLVATATSGGATSTSIEIDTSAIEERISALEDAIVKIKPIAGNGINIEVEKGGSVISANIDENSLSFNSEGQLCVNPDILSDYLNEGTNGECANHTHTASQISDLSEFVTNIINNSSILNTLKSNLQNLVDETTIIINSDGKLESIATNVQKHQHTMDDITDLNQDIANVWATNQRLHAGNDNQNFNSGAVMMSSLTVGEVLIAFNELLKEQQQSIANVSSKTGSIEPVEPDLINNATFKNRSDLIKVLDVQTMTEVDASKTAIIGTDDVIFYNGSIIHAYIDDIEVGTLNAYDTDNTSFTTGRFGNFIVTYYGDAYPKFKSFQGYYKGFSFNYVADNLSEGIHTIYFTQVNVNNDITVTSEKLTFNIYNDFIPTGYINIIEQPDYTGYVSGVKCSNTSNPKITFSPVIKNFVNRFTPITTNTAEVLGKTYDLTINELTDNGLSYKPITVDLDNSIYGKVEIKAFISNFAGNITEISKNTVFINIDDTTEEEYRWVQDSGNMEPTDNGTTVFSKYDPSDALIGKYSDEMQIIDHIAQIGNTDYSKNDLGVNYAIKDTTEMITLRFDTPKINNFYFDLYDENGDEFSINKNGTLKDISIYASISPSNVTTRWVNCNEPYAGYGSWVDGRIFNGLDLFRTEGPRKWVTFGKDPISESGYLYIKLISNGAKIDLSKLVSSIKECLNERQ